jgi:hypothetical protein
MIKVMKRGLLKAGMVMRAQSLKLMRKEVDEHEATYKDDISRDFIDVYLAQRKKSDPNSSFGSEEGCELEH